MKDLTFTPEEVQQMKNAAVERFTLKEIEAAMAECESLDEYICQGDLIAALTRPEPEFSEGQIVCFRFNGSLTRWHKASDANPSTRRPLTQTEVGPDWRPAKDWEALDILLQAIVRKAADPSCREDTSRYLWDALAALDKAIQGGE